MNTFIKTTLFALPLVLAGSIASANFEMKIVNKTDGTYKIDSVAAGVGNMRCNGPDGRGLGTNADFSIDAGTTVTCSISHTHGSHYVQFNIAASDLFYKAVRIVAAGGSDSGTLVAVPPVNPVTSIDGHTINIIGDFVNH